MRGHLGAGRQEASLSAYQYTIRHRVLWIETPLYTIETMQDIYSDNYGIKVYTGNCIIQLNVNPKNLSESFFDVYDRDGMKLIYSIQNSILKEMFVI